jgi:hypothetical protein
MSSLPPTDNESQLQLWTLATLEVLVGFFALLSVVAGRASAGAKIGGVLLVLAYITLAMVEDFTPLYYSGGYVFLFVDSSLYGLLYLGWAVSRPFRGPGYFGILILIALEFVSYYLSPAIYNAAGQAGLILIALVNALFVLAVIGFSGLFERQSSAQPVLAGAALDGASNGKARASFALALSAIGVNVVSRLIPTGLGTAISIAALGMLVAAIVMGHLARREIRVTNQRGAGMALAGLLIGYIILGIDVAIIVASLVAIAAITSAY